MLMAIICMIGRREEVYCKRVCVVCAFSVCVCVCVCESVCVYVREGEGVRV